VKEETRALGLLITNRHVAARGHWMTICGHGHDGSIRHANEMSGIPSGMAATVEIDRPMWFVHPNEDVDLAMMPLAPYPELVNRLYKQYVLPSNVWSDERLRELSALEDVVMCGCPDGLWDEHNGLPLLRRGTTATHPALRFENSAYGLVDIACFQGSSGSPVCVLNEGPHAVKLGGDLRIEEARIATGGRFILLGVLSHGAYVSTDGLLEKRPIPTTREKVPVVPQMIHLGYYVRADEIMTMVDALKRNELKPMQVFAS
jgi:hypothetical protein